MKTEQNHSKFYKILPTVLVAMTLAGCGASGKYVKGNGFSFIARWIQFFGDSQTDFAFGVNSYIGQLAFKVNSFLSDHIVDQAKTAYGGFSKYVTIFQWIALAYILIKFGQLIFQNYFTENQKYAQNSVSILKKLVICFALVWAMPYAVFTGYFVSTEAGFTVSQQIANADTEGGETVRYELFTEMSNIGASGHTYCKFNTDVPGPDPDGGVGEVMYNPHSDNGTSTGSKTLDGILRAKAKNDSKDIDYFLGDGVESTEETRYNELVREYTDVWDSTCGQFADKEGDDYKYETYNVYRLAEAVNNGTNRNIITLKDSASSVLDLFTVVVNCFFFLVAGISIVHRLLDCILLIATGWFYIGNYLTDEQGTYLQKFIAQLGSIIITQFTVIVEIGLFNAMQSGLGSSGVDPMFVIASNIAWGLLLIGTPAAISSMFNQTGATGFAAKAGSHLVNSIRNK